MNSFEHVYVHIPFCDVICHYCDFYTARTKDARFEEFFTSLNKESEKQKPHRAPHLKALYMGGGTPSASPAPLLEKFLRTFGSAIDASTEVTLEANPNHLTEENLLAWKDMGINRLSLGIQSLEDSTLKRLGRTHSGAEALSAIERAGKIFSNLSCDLIYAVPDQSVDRPAQDAAAILGAGAHHLSAYHLTLEPQHFLYARLPTDEQAKNQIAKVVEICASHGLDHYEMSNFGSERTFSRNNLNYWGGGSYGALGPSAHGFDGERKRWRNLADWKAYGDAILKGENPLESEETLTDEQRRIEVLFTGLRTKFGISLSKYERDFGYSFLERHKIELDRLVNSGLALIDGDRFKLTFEGRLLTDEVVKRIL